MGIDLKNFVASYHDFPTKGILYRDILPLLSNGKVFQKAVTKLAECASKLGAQVIVAPEARGFILGSAVASKLGIGFVPARKEGKLPGKVIKKSYGLEYGNAALYMQTHEIKPQERVVIMDDLLATGGTLKATIDLVEGLGGKVVGVCFLIELQALNGRKKLANYAVHSIIKYD